MPDTVPAGAAASSADLKDAVERALELARAQGASEAEAEASRGTGHNVTVRLGEVETIEYNRDKDLSVTVYFGKRRGSASTSDFSADAIAATVDAACHIAQHTAPDDAAGLPERERLAFGDLPDLDLNHPWGISVERGIEIAQATEAAARGVDKRITNSEGATVSAFESDFIYGNSLGFVRGYPSSRASVSVAVIAEAKGAMERDYWYDSQRHADDLEPFEQIGRTAGQRAIRRLGAKKLGTLTVPVLYEAPVAAGLLSALVNAASGSSLYRKTSFLVDRLGTDVFAPCVTVREEPHVRRGQASAPFDAEGVATQPRIVVDRGVLRGYFLSTYSARKLGLATTGNAGGNHNLIADSTGESFDALLAKMGRGLLVTELMGQGINLVTGDYSRGAVGFWVEGGRIAYPVHEVTIAGNLNDMFRGIVAIGTDRYVAGSKQTGSILVDAMTVAGN